MPLVSVILPNYNHSSFLQQRISTILNQSFQDFELILLDDCSTDDSKEILEYYRNHPKVSVLFLNKMNTGSPFKQWAKGILFTKGKYIWIAESDDYSDPTFLAKTVHEFARNPSLGMVFTNSHWVDNNGIQGKDLSIYSGSFIRNGRREILEALSKYNSIQNVSSVVFNAAHLRKVSIAYTNYKSCGDWILYTELLMNSDVAYIEEKLNYFRWYHQNTSNKAYITGLWEYEGVDVLKIIKNRVVLNRSQKSDILISWKKRISDLRVTVPFSFKKYLLIHKKLFLFSPFVYIRIFLLAR